MAEGFSSGTTTMSVNINPDVSISVAPYINDILPIGHADDPDSYHVQIKTEPLALVYITDSLERTITRESDAEGDVWVELDLQDTSYESLRIVTRDYWGNSASSEVILSSNLAKSSSFDVSYLSYNQTGKEIDTLSENLTEEVSESMGLNVVDELEQYILAVDRGEAEFASKLSASAEPFIVKILKPYGFLIILIGLALLVIGFYFRMNPLPTTKD